MSVLKALNSFAGTKILVIGDIILDIYIHGSVDRISPEAPVPILNHHHTHHALGGAANVAANLKGLGAEVDLISIVGDDTEAEFLVTLLDLEDIAHSLIPCPDRPTTSKSRVIAGNHQMLRIDHETSKELTAYETKKLLQTIIEKIEEISPQAIVLEDYNKGLFTMELIESISSVAKKLQVQVIVDPKDKNFFSFKGCTLFKPNFKECARKIPFEIKPELESLNMADAYLREQLHHQISMITLAEHGVYISDGASQYLIPTEIRQVSDVSGAGDTVTAIATLGMINALSLEEIAGLSNIAAGIVCGKSGVHAIKREELTSYYN